MELKVLLKLNPLENGQYTVTAPYPNTYHRADPNDKSQPGDVISITPSGEIQTRPEGTEGSWERCSLDGIVTKYQPSNGPIFLVTPTGF